MARDAADSIACPALARRRLSSAPLVVVLLWAALCVGPAPAAGGRRSTAGHTASGVGRGRVAALQRSGAGDLAADVLARPEDRRSPHRDAELRPESRGHDPRDLSRRRSPPGTGRHRLQLPDRRAGTHLRRALLAGVPRRGEPHGRGHVGRGRRGRACLRPQLGNRRHRPARQLRSAWTRRPAHAPRSSS